MRPYGWNPDRPDHRDFLYASVHRPATITLPQKVSLRDKMPAVYDQGALGSCTANAICGAFGFVHQGFSGSRLQLYYKERVMEHSVHDDSGAMIRDGVKALHRTGVAPESMWPYDVSKFARRPTLAATREAHNHRLGSYSRLTSGNDFRACLADGHPFVIGFSVYESFESEEVARTGIVPLPSKAEADLGGHAVCVIGYDMTFQGRGPFYEVRNSWGADWGDGGNFWVPAAYFENPNLADDAWTLRS